MTERKTLLWYHLPKAYVKITGTVTTRATAGGAKTSSAATQFALETRADPEKCYGVRLERSLFSDSELTLEVSEKGLLTSTTAVSTGQLGTVFKNVASFAASVAGAAVGLGIFPVAAARRPAAASAKTAYAQQHPDLARRRREIEDAIGKLLDALVSKEASLASEADADARAEIRTHVADLHMAIEELRQQAEPLDQHYVAWKAARTQESTATYEFELAIGELPTLNTIEGLAGAAPTAVELGSSFPVYQALGIVIARPASVPATQTAGLTLPGSGSTLSGAFYRKTVPLRLSLFSNASGTLELMETEIHDVADEDSTPGYIEFKRNLWSRSSIEASFSALGSLASLKRTKTSTAAAASATLKELPSEVLEALKQADSLVDAQQKLSLQGVDHRIEQLSRRKQQLEGEIALNELIDSRDLVAQLQAVNAEKELLSARKQLGEARVALAAHETTAARQLETEVNRLQKELASSEKDLLLAQEELEDAHQALAINEATETIRTQTEILKLRQTMEQAQIDRAQVLAELRALRSDED